ncbi:MAG TPA: PorV/PorQ family protein, partial [Saprospiraceae bacterium]|nr:PorV/PorQ family protein [Saprospiraceae bacterium]
MKKLLYTLICLLTFNTLFAGNPDRQGEAGAGELLLNPWARSSGLHTMTTANIMGVEAMQLNVAGMSRIENTQVLFGNTTYLKGSDLSLNAAGLATKMSENSTFGISIMSVGFGKIPITTTNQPEGIGATYSPSYFNIGIAYSYMFQNKISVGLLVRGVSESIADISAFGMAFDAGVQYVTGDKNQFKLGISLRNIGGPMVFEGQGLSTAQNLPEGYPITLTQRPASYELPSMLNMGVSYDFILAPKAILTGLFNFTSNSFSPDQAGLGAEFSFMDIFRIRAAYKYEFGQEVDGGLNSSLDRGLAAGVGVEVPLKKNSKNTI